MVNRDAHIGPINPTYQVESNKNDQLSPVTGQTKNLNTIDENDHMSPVTGQTKNPNAIDFSQLMVVQRQQSEMIMNLVSQLSGVTQSLAQLQKGVSTNLGEEEDNSEEYNSNCSEHQSVSHTQAEASIIEQCTASLALTENKGMPASQEMGNFLQTCMSSRLDNKKRESLCEKHLIPENTRLLHVPKVNEEIWRVLSLDARSKDAKLQKIQSNCLRAIVQVVRAIDHLVKNQSQTDQVDVESIVTLLVDSLALISCASSDMNPWRRDLMKKELNHEYTALCSQKNPLTE